MPSLRHWLSRIVAAGAIAAGEALPRLDAAEWMFRPSYFSHADSVGHAGIVPHSRSAYRPAYVGSNPRFAIRGGTRFNNVIIRNGNSFDRTLIREDWFDAGYE